MKVNAVAIKGVTEDDVVPLGRFAREHGLELRFIEYMPLDAGDRWERDKVLFAAEILERLADGIGPLAPAPDQDPRAPAVDYDYADGGGRVGLIASVSRPFCMSCNRVRLTADGKLRNCLFALEETDIRALLRGGRRRRRDRPGPPRERRRQVGRARDQHRPVHQARAADALDRRLNARHDRTHLRPRSPTPTPAFRFSTFLDNPPPTLPKSITTVTTQRHRYRPDFFHI